MLPLRRDEMLAALYAVNGSNAPRRGGSQRIIPALQLNSNSPKAGSVGFCTVMRLLCGLSPTKLKRYQTNTVRLSSTFYASESIGEIHNCGMVVKT